MTRRVVAAILGNVFVAAILGAVILLATTPGAGLVNTITGRLTDAGCVAVFLGILAALAALYPVAVRVDREGRWHQ